MLLRDGEAVIIKGSRGLLLVHSLCPRCQNAQFPGWKRLFRAFTEKLYNCSVDELMTICCCETIGVSMLAWETWRPAEKENISHETFPGNSFVTNTQGFKQYLLYAFRTLHHWWFRPVNVFCNIDRKSYMTCHEFVGL